MVVILIRWYIKNDKTTKFISHWENVMKVSKGKGLFRETLCKANPKIEDPKFHTFNLDNPFYTTFINVGMWESVDAFDNAVSAPYIRKPILDGDREEYLHITEFEFKIRERIVLEEVSSRGIDLPKAKMEE